MKGDMMIPPIRKRLSVRRNNAKTPAFYSDEPEVAVDVPLMDRHNRCKAIILRGHDEARGVFFVTVDADTIRAAAARIVEMEAEYGQGALV
jgi:hypothetical protein